MANLLIREIMAENHINPYHGAEHAKAVASAGSEICEKIKIITRPFSEIKPALLAHDINHPGKNTTPDDEKNSARKLRKIAEKHRIPENKISLWEKMIISTIFQNRGEGEPTSETMMIQDADVHNIGLPYIDFLRQSAKLYIEQNPGYPSEAKIKGFFKGTLHGFFPSLTKITGDENNPFLIPEIGKRVFTNFERNRDTLATNLENNMGLLTSIVCDEREKFHGKKAFLEL